MSSAVLGFETVGAESSYSLFPGLASLGCFIGWTSDEVPWFISIDVGWCYLAMVGSLGVGGDGVDGVSVLGRGCRSWTGETTLDVDVEASTSGVVDSLSSAANCAGKGWAVSSILD